MDIAELLAFSVKNKASDLHLSAGLPPMIRVDGDVRRINIPALDHKQVHALVYDIMSDKQRRDYEEFLEVDFSLRDPRPGPLPRQRVQPEPRRRRGVPHHSLGSADARGPGLPAHLQGADRAAAGPDPGDRADRLGQVDHAGGDDRPHQQERIRPHPLGRGPDRIRAHLAEVPDQPARSAPRHPRLQRGAALGAARRPGLSSWSASCATSRPSAWR